jgi:hypothetical protein
MTDQWITGRDFGIAVIDFGCGFCLGVASLSFSSPLTAFCHRRILAPRNRTERLTLLRTFPQSILAVDVAQYKVALQIAQG